MKPLKTRIAAPLLAGLAAVIAATGAAQAAPHAQKQCFYAGNVDNFAAQSDRIVNIRVGVRDVYQFELMTPCPDIRWNQRMGLVASGGSNWICSGIDAEVISHSSIGPQRCPVSHIRKLSPAEIAALPRGAKP